MLLPFLMKGIAFFNRRKGKAPLAPVFVLRGA